ncbi:hypothetical protein LTS18_005782, partial [Coniosporium uncinatum]
MPESIRQSRRSSRILESIVRHASPPPLDPEGWQSRRTSLFDAGLQERLQRALNENRIPDPEEPTNVLQMEDAPDRRTGIKEEVRQEEEQKVAEVCNLRTQEAEAQGLDDVSPVERDENANKLPEFGKEPSPMRHENEGEVVVAQEAAAEPNDLSQVREIEPQSVADQRAQALKERVESVHGRGDIARPQDAGSEGRHVDAPTPMRRLSEHKTGLDQPNGGAGRVAQHERQPQPQSVRDAVVNTDQHPPSDHQLRYPQHKEQATLAQSRASEDSQSYLPQYDNARQPSQRSYALTAMGMSALQTISNAAANTEVRPDESKKGDTIATAEQRKERVDVLPFGSPDRPASPQRARPSALRNDAGVTADVEEDVKRSSSTPSAVQQRFQSSPPTIHLHPDPADAEIAEDASVTNPTVSSVGMTASDGHDMDMTQRLPVSPMTAAFPQRQQGHEQAAGVGADLELERPMSFVPLPRDSTGGLPQEQINLPTPDTREQKQQEPEGPLSRQKLSPPPPPPQQQQQQQQQIQTQTQTQTQTQQPQHQYHSEQQPPNPPPATAKLPSGFPPQSQDYSLPAAGRGQRQLRKLQKEGDGEAVWQQPGLPRKTSLQNPDVMRETMDPRYRGAEFSLPGVGPPPTQQGRDRSKEGGGSGQLRLRGFLRPIGRVGGGEASATEGGGGGGGGGRGGGGVGGGGRIDPRHAAEDMGLGRMGSYQSVLEEETTQAGEARQQSQQQQQQQQQGRKRDKLFRPFGRPSSAGAESLLSSTGKGEASPKREQAQAQTTAVVVGPNGREVRQLKKLQRASTAGHSPSPQRQGTPGGPQNRDEQGGKKEKEKDKEKEKRFSSLKGLFGRSGSAPSRPNKLSKSQKVEQSRRPRLGEERESGGSAYADTNAYRQGLGGQREQQPTIPEVDQNTVFVGQQQRHPDYSTAPPPPGGYYAPQNQQQQQQQPGGFGHTQGRSGFAAIDQQAQAGYQQQPQDWRRTPTADFPSASMNDQQYGQVGPNGLKYSSTAPSRVRQGQPSGWDYGRERPPPTTLRHSSTGSL